MIYHEPKITDLVAGEWVLCTSGSIYSQYLTLGKVYKINRAGMRVHGDFTNYVIYLIDDDNDTDCCLDIKYSTIVEERLLSPLKYYTEEERFLLLLGGDLQ